MNNSEQKKSSNVQGASNSELDGKREPIVDQAKHALTNVAGQAREQVTHRMDVRKDKAVEKMTGVAGAIRETSEKLDGMGPLGDVAGRAADGIERVAQFFEGKQVTDIVRDVERFARREPAIFLGAAFAVGLIGGRFLKSSAHRSESVGSSGHLRDESWEGYGDGFLSPEDLEDYESRRFGREGFVRSEGFGKSDDFRDTMPMGSRSAQSSSSFGSTSPRSEPRIEKDGPKIPPSSIVNAASVNESPTTTAPMRATQGSAGASASTTSPSSAASQSPTTTPGNGNTGRV